MLLIGHNKQQQYFNQIIANGMLGHAYLFSGPEMIGKKSFALNLFDLINRRSFKNDPDFVSVSPDLSKEESKIYIEDVRKLKSFFYLRPYFGPYKFALINDAHCLTSEASNALLKILEEPPSFSIIILVTSLLKLLPATLVSRCEPIRFNEAGDEELNSYLAGQKIKPEDKEFLVKLARGRIGLVNRLLEDNGILEARKAIDDLRKLLNSGIYEKMDYAKKVHEKAVQGGSLQRDYGQLVGYWLNWVSAHVRNSPKNAKIVKNLLVLHQLISQSQFNHRLALENFLLNL